MKRIPKHKAQKPRDSAFKEALPASSEQTDRIPKPELNEVATAQNDIDLFAGYLKVLENPDAVLRTEAAGKGLKLYDEIDRDPHAGSVLQTRYLSVVGKEWEVLPGDDPAARGRKPTQTFAEKVAEFVKNALLGCNFDQFRQELLQGILYGFYGAEVMWQVLDNNIVPARILAKHPRRFAFTPERALRLITVNAMLEGEPVPDRKFIVFTYGSSDNPYGSGLGQKLWWPVWFKKNAIKFWLIFSEKFGMPTTVGKYPPGTDPTAQQALLDAIDAIQTETGIKIPDTMTIELLEAQRQGSVNTYETLCTYMDKQISKAVLGQTATTEGTPGKLGNEEAQQEVRQDIVKADADLLCECLNNSLVRWICDYNFPNPIYPKLWIRTGEEEDLKPLAERDEILVSRIGLPVAKRYFYETYAIPEPEEGEELVEPKKAQPASPGIGDSDEGTGFAESADPSPADTLDRLGEKTIEAANLDSLIEPIKKLLDESESLEQFRDRLLDIYGGMKTADLGNLMQKALILADLSGRFDAKER